MLTYTFVISVPRLGDKTDRFPTRSLSNNTKYRLFSCSLLRMAVALLIFIWPVCCTRLLTGSLNYKRILVKNLKPLSIFVNNASILIRFLIEITLRRINNLIDLNGTVPKKVLRTQLIYFFIETTTNILFAGNANLFFLV